MLTIPFVNALLTLLFIVDGEDQMHIILYCNKV